MPYRFASQLQLDSVPDEQLDNQFEVIMPEIDLLGEGSHDISLSYLPKTVTNVLNIPFASTARYSPIVEEISFGTTSFKTTARRIRTNWINFAEDIENYKAVDITMFCSNGMLTQYYLNRWKNLVFDTTAEAFNSASEYKKSIEVFFYGLGGIRGPASQIAQFSLKGCFPVSQRDYVLKYTSDPNRITITQTFSVDNIIPSKNLATKAIRNEMLSSPLNAVGSAVGDLLFPTTTSTKAGLGDNYL